MSKKTTLIASLLLPLVSFAGPFIRDDTGETPTAPASRPYSFSGPCTSQGSWTQAALNQTGRIREVVMQLKNDANCSALSKNLEASLTSIDQNLRDVEGSGRGARLAQLPAEIMGLRQFVTGDGVFRSRVMDSLMGRTFEQATMAAKLGAPMSTQASVDQGSQSAAEAMLGLGDRVRRATNTGLDLFNKFLEQAPAMEQCLVNPEGASQYFAASVKVLASFASSGQDGTGVRLATAVSRLGNIFGREAKFAEMLRQLNEQDFLVSMTCLMEVTSESYCSARDARLLFDTIRQSGKINRKGEVRGGNPLHGYYILNEHLPVVNRWLQTVQVGVSSRRPEDAAARIRVINEVQAFFNAVEKLKATMAFDIERINSESTVDEQAATLAKLIRKLMKDMWPSNGLGEDIGPARENFFTTVGSAPEILFMLLNEPGLLQEFRESDENDLMDWVEKKRNVIGAYKNPRAFMPQLQKSFDDIVERAQRAAQAYYQRYFVADQISVVNKALLGAHLNVKTALAGIDGYLAALDRKMVTGGDVTMVASIRDTRRRIRDIMMGFEEVRAFGAKVAKTPRQEEDAFSEDAAEAQDVELLRVTSKLLQTVALRLDMQNAQTTFLSTRLADLVSKDYEMMLQSGQNFSPYHQELFEATGDAMYNNMLRVSNGNPALVEHDLNLAMRLNKGNIEILQRLLLNPFATQVAFLKLLGENRKPGSWTLFWESNRRAFEETSVNLPGENRSAPWNFMRGFFGALWTGWVNSDRYPYQSPTSLFRFTMGRYNYSPDDEFGSAKKLQSQLCVQALAFNDIRPFWTLCRGTGLQTPYIVDSSLKLNGQNAEDYLSVSFEKKAYEAKENASLNHSQRICAFRDYNRRNLVMYLTEKNR